MKAMKRVVKTSLFLGSLLAATVLGYNFNLIGRDAAYVALHIELALFLCAPAAIFLMFKPQK
ncbi:MAG: hypothetical protein CMJ20_01865 [Phycisphaeraceae bacterium]|nr:hypothetical protein [Phycisphaeraceae bacterium]